MLNLNYQTKLNGVKNLKKLTTCSKLLHCWKFSCEKSLSTIVLQMKHRSFLRGPTIIIISFFNNFKTRISLILKYKKVKENDLSKLERSWHKLKMRKNTMDTWDKVSNKKNIIKKYHL